MTDRGWQRRMREATTAVDRRIDLGQYEGKADLTPRPIRYIPATDARASDYRAAEAARRPDKPSLTTPKRAGNLHLDEVFLLDHVQFRVTRMPEVYGLGPMMRYKLIAADPDGLPRTLVISHSEMVDSLGVANGVTLTGASDADDTPK